MGIDGRLDRAEKFLADAGSCARCKERPRWVRVGSVEDKYATPPPCEACGALDYTVIISGTVRLPGDPEVEA